MTKIVITCAAPVERLDHFEYEEESIEEVEVLLEYWRTAYSVQERMPEIANVMDNYLGCEYYADPEKEFVNYNKISVIQLYPETVEEYNNLVRLFGGQEYANAVIIFKPVIRYGEKEKVLPIEHEVNSKRTDFYGMLFPKIDETIDEEDDENELDYIPLFHANGRKFIFVDDDVDVISI